jgi:phage gpG-like protein
MRSPIQESMAEKFFEIVRLNFGNFGVDRPVEWAPLSPAYAKRVNREHATLFVSGKLESSVKTESNEDRARVFITKDDVVYALAHQYGVPSKGLPPRPYFPIDTNGEVTPFTKANVEEAAREATARLIGGGIL